MSNFIKKENMVIVVGEYEKDGQMKKQYKTIGELVTMQGENGPYQFFKQWGPGGVVEGKVFEQQDNNQSQPQQFQQQPQQQAPQQNFQQQAPHQGGYAVNPNQPNYNPHG